MSLKDNLLSLNNLRKFAGFAILNQAINADFKLEAYNAMPQSRVLVLSPHPDDDVIGCGGTIKLHSESGSIIKTVYLTDGSGGSGKLTKEKQQKLVSLRENEARKAAEIVGANDLVFWRYQDGRLPVNKTTEKLLSTLISDFQPDIIYAPSFLDPHPDHLATVRILANALKKLPYEGIIYFYEIWAPLYINRLVNIDQTVDKKELAVLSHESQIKERSYFDAVMGLNRYRAGMYNAGTYAEGFLSTTKELFLKLFDIANFKINKK